MAIGNAMKFIKKIEEDPTFRKSLYGLSNRDELFAFLQEKDLTYNAGEFDEAFNHLHTMCQHSEQADQLFNAKNLILLTLPFLHTL